MFSNLVESKGRKTRRGSMTFSFIAHYGLVLGAIYTSASAEVVGKGPRQEKVEFMVRPEPVKKPTPTAPELAAVPQVPKPAPILVAPIDIPSALPDIDLTERVTDPDDFIRRGTTRAEPGRATAVATASPKDKYFVFEVEKPVVPAPNSAAPVYPDILRQAGVEGEALVSFVVDTTGRVDLSSVQVVRASHALFAAAVRNALPRMRFIAAEIGDRKVRQLVQQPFTFAIAK